MKIIIVGAGPGGYETALEAAKKDIDVVLVEKGELGGTCLNEGCIPTKTFVRSAEIYSEALHGAEFGVLCEPKLDFERVRSRKAQVVEQLKAGVASLLKHKRITLVSGEGRIVDAHRVQVGEELFEADYIIVASGSYPATLPIEGAQRAISSTELLDIDHVPESLTIIGAGVIGLEFASIFNAFGCKVRVIEYAKQILPRFDTDLAKRLKQSLSKSGIEIITSAAVSSIQEDGVHYMLKEKENVVQSEIVLMATGRRPRVQGLGLENAGVEFSGKGIAVDENMVTNVPSILAIGDCNGLCMLAHAAVAQGKRALSHILGEEDNLKLETVPSVVFTMPEAAMVGLTEEDCEQNGVQYKALKGFYRSNGKAVSMGQTDGLVKLVVEEGQGRILGAHIYGPHAGDLVSEITAYVQQGLNLEQLRDTIHAHPTLSEILVSLA